MEKQTNDEEELNRAIRELLEQENRSNVNEGEMPIKRIGKKKPTIMEENIFYISCPCGTESS